MLLEQGGHITALVEVITAELPREFWLQIVSASAKGSIPFPATSPRASVSERPVDISVTANLCRTQRPWSR